MQGVRPYLKTPGRHLCFEGTTQLSSLLLSARDYTSTAQQSHIVFLLWSSKIVYNVQNLPWEIWSVHSPSSLRDRKEMEIHPNLESAFVILNILHSMCCNSCFKACQVCLQKHHPYSEQDNQSHPVKIQGRIKPQIQGDGVLQSEPEFVNHSVLFLRGKFLICPFSPPSSYPQIEGLAPLPLHA